MQSFDADLLERSAIVFSPHYDDETLGAGGTIVQKRRHAADVYLVFMTDGSQSHAAAMDGARLAALRRQEALDAARTLGVQPDRVRFLDLPETRLSEHTAEAVDRVGALLAEFRCQQVFVPSTLEPVVWSEDHKATTEIVFRALSRLDERPEILEYLVWFWYHWPWVPLLGHADFRQILTLTWTNRFGLAARGVLNTAVPITPVHPIKRLALEQYRSQMTRLSVDKPWPVLADVGGGEFLNCFFQPSEFFYRYTYTDPRDFQV